MSKAQAATGVVAALKFEQSPQANLYGVTFTDGFESGDLVTWSLTLPEDSGTITEIPQISSTPIKGILPEEKIQDLEFITEEGQKEPLLIGLTTMGGLYEIDCSNGNATFKGSIPQEFVTPRMNLVYDSQGRLLIATEAENFQFGFLTGQVERINPPLQFAPGDPNEGQQPQIGGLGALTPDPITGLPRIYAYDGRLFSLAELNPPGGQAFTLGPLFSGSDGNDIMDINGKVGFDIPVPESKIGIITFIDPTGPNASELYRVNLDTGAAERVGRLGGGKPVAAIAFPPAQGASCKFEPNTVSRRPGSGHVGTVIVMVNGVPAAGATVNIKVTDGPNEGITETVVTDANGRAAFTYFSNGELGTDHIMASGSTAGGDTFFCTSLVHWTNDPLPRVECRFLTNNHILPIGGTCTGSVEVLVDGEPVAGATVNIKVTSGPNEGLTQTLTTEAFIQGVNFKYTSNGQPGTDHILATVEVQGQSSSCEAVVHWVVNPGFRCEVESRDARKPLGEKHEVKVTAFSNEVPIPGEPVIVEVIDGPNKGVRLEGVTDDNGQVTIGYQGNGERGTDIIRISAFNEHEVPAVCAATVEWTGAPIISSVRPKAKKLIIEGFNFMEEDIIEIDGQRPKKVIFKNDHKLVVKGFAETFRNCDIEELKEIILRALRERMQSPGNAVIVPGCKSGG